MNFAKQGVIAALALCASLPMAAADFTVDGICYNIISVGRQTCEVTSRGEELYYTGSLTIPETVVDDYDNTEYTVIAIGKNAFFYCTDLTSVTLPNTIQSLKEGSFEMTGITTLNIPESVTTIGEDCFWSSKLESITVPGSVKELGDNAFRMCRQLTSITFEEGVESLGAASLYCCEALTTLRFPESLTTIGDKCFQSCEALTDIEISKNVSNVGEGLFVNCTNLESVAVNAENPYLKSVDGVLFSADGKTLYAYPFGKQGESYTVPAGTETIVGFAFQKNPSLKSVKLADETLSLGQYCFNEIPNFTSIDFGTSLQTIGDFCFMNVPLVKEFNFPQSLKTICQMAISKNTGLTQIVIPDGVETIGDYAFFGCDKVTEIHIGSGLKSLDKIVFQRTYSVQDVYCSAIEPPTSPAKQFQDDNYASATLHVPTGTADAYSEAEGWKYFATIVDDIAQSGVDNVLTDNTDSSFSGSAIVEAFTLDGRKAYNGPASSISLPRGLYILRSGSASRKLLIP
jgi:hypothetical protein